MGLLGNQKKEKEKEKEMRSENLERERNPQGIETENLDRKRNSLQEIEMGSENLDRTRTHQEIETQVEKEISKEEENENQIAEDGIGKEDGFSIDEVCPICFDRFTIPCRTNCGHWYCGSCILEFWEFRSSIQPFKCPLCSCLITNLVPVISQPIGPEEDVIMVVQKVRQYNCLYIGGVRGFFLKVLALPLVIKRIFRIVMDPHNFRWTYYLMRFLGEGWGFTECLMSVPTCSFSLSLSFVSGANGKPGVVQEEIEDLEAIENLDSAAALNADNAAENSRWRRGGDGVVGGLGGGRWLGLRLDPGIVIGDVYYDERMELEC
ncbi:RING/U-box superfamily protein [Forsythia ovata]|uniref:RING/U-box superfamily protein n=1 Tax=Forsythia ovata TaxID=205694 RepID=A0ABD1QMU8_9LAMI